MLHLQRSAACLQPLQRVLHGRPRYHGAQQPRRLISSIGDGATATTAAQPQQAMTKVVLVVAVALLDTHGRVLLAQRPPGKPMAGLWEFPGGKIDAGETPEAALVRELKEELNIEVGPQDLQPLTFASHTYDTFHLLMPLFGCRSWQGEVQGVEGQQLTWAAAHQLQDYPMPAADIPLIPAVAAACAAAAQRPA